MAGLSASRRAWEWVPLHEQLETLEKQNQTNMKKTLIALMALGTSVMADSITLSSTSTAGNYNSTTHGFFLSLSSDELQITTPGVTLPDVLALDSITLKASNAANVGNNVTYGLVVLGQNDNTVLGFSTSTVTSAANNDVTFAFTGIASEELLLTSKDTYRFITVSSGVLDLFTGSTKTYVYNAGGTGAVSYETNANTVTISQGLTAPGLRWNYDTSASVDDCCAIFSSAIGTGKPEYSPVITNMTVNIIPEPATATLSLLALAGLAARRRRK